MIPLSKLFLATTFFLFLAFAAPSVAEDTSGNLRPENFPGGPGNFFAGPKDAYLFTSHPGRWSAEKATAWYAKQPWLVGVNFLPSTAVNSVEMWQQGSFDAVTIERELGWAHDLGFNTVRVVVNYAVWDADAKGLKNRFDWFLGTAKKMGIRVVPVLLDGCDARHSDAHVGPQLDPVAGVHNSRWVASVPPMVTMEDGTQEWSPRAEQYIKDMVGTFAQDDRVVIWDLYNEPDSKECLPLVEATFRWAREVNPSQPLASCWLGEPFSDLINLHEYGPLGRPKTVQIRDPQGKIWITTSHALKVAIQNAEKTGRPVIVTEWMARDMGSRFESHLPFFKSRKIGCWSWGLVAGRSQTYFPWDSKPGSPPPKLWHHDILWGDGTPYSERETDIIRYYTGAIPTTKSVASLERDH